jgi:hypothetical protein
LALWFISGNHYEALVRGSSDHREWQVLSVMKLLDEQGGGGLAVLTFAGKAAAVDFVGLFLAGGFDRHEGVDCARGGSGFAVVTFAMLRRSLPSTTPGRLLQGCERHVWAARSVSVHVILTPRMSGVAVVCLLVVACRCWSFWWLLSMVLVASVSVSLSLFCLLPFVFVLG